MLPDGDKTHEHPRYATEWGAIAVLAAAVGLVLFSFYVSRWQLGIATDRIDELEARVAAVEVSCPTS